MIVADQRQHYNMARSMAALSLSFIILVTPWTLKEVAVSCIGTKVFFSLLFPTIRVAKLIIVGRPEADQHNTLEMGLMIFTPNQIFVSFTM